MESIRKNITYNDLLDFVYESMQVDKDLYDLELSTTIEATGRLCHTRIKRDKDIRVMMMASHMKAPILYVKIISSPTPPVHDDDVGGGDVGGGDVGVVDLGGGDVRGVDVGIGDIGGGGCVGNDDIGGGSDIGGDGIGRGVDWAYNRAPQPPRPHASNVESSEERADSTQFMNIPGSSNYSLVQIVDDVSQGPIGQFQKGDVFMSKEKLIRAIQMWSLKEKFETRTRRSNKSEYVVGCKGESCKFHLRATIMTNSTCWKVQKCTRTHTCIANGFQSRLRTCSSKLIGDLMAPKLQIDGNTLKPNTIVGEMQQEWGIDCRYAKAWKAKEHAEALVFGPPEESFGVLPGYFHMLQLANPGTIYALETDESNQFKQCFWAFGAAIDGFKYTRPVLAIDGTHLKGRFKGILFVAAGRDANGQAYPVGLGVAHIEEESSWTWFLTQLRVVVGCPPGFMLISDQHKAIKVACANVYPDAPHGLCSWHLKRNLTNKYKSNDVSKFFNLAAIAYSHGECLKFFEELRGHSPRAYESLGRIGIERWSRSHSPQRRFEHMTSNMAESMNSALLHARQMPITVIVDFIRDLFQRWYHKRREFAKAITTPLTPPAMKVINDSLDEAHHLRVNPINGYEFQVKDLRSHEVVNLLERTCTCGFFQTDMLPCKHAAAAISKVNQPLTAFCSSFYYASTLFQEYAGSVMPVIDRDRWVLPEEVRDRVVLAPSWRGQAGRPRRQRIPSAGEPSRRRRCSLCNSMGHNRQRCNNPTGAPPVEQPSGPRKRACSFCRQRGHKRNNCPSAPPSSYVPPSSSSNIPEEEEDIGLDDIDLDDIDLDEIFC